MVNLAPTIDLPRLRVAVLFVVTICSGLCAANIRTEVVERVAAAMGKCLEMTGARNLAPSQAAALFRILLESDGLYGGYASLNEEEAIAVSKKLTLAGFPLHRMEESFTAKPLSISAVTSLAPDDKRQLAIEEVLNLLGLRRNSYDREKLAWDLASMLEVHLMDWDAILSHDLVFSHVFSKQPPRKSTQVVIGENTIELNAPGSLGDMLTFISQSRLGNTLVARFQHQLAAGNVDVRALTRSPLSGAWQRKHERPSLWGMDHADFRYSPESGFPTLWVNYDSDLADSVMPLVHSLYHAVDDLSGDDDHSTNSKPELERQVARRLVYNELLELFPQAVVLEPTVDRPHWLGESSPMSSPAQASVEQQKAQACQIVLAKLRPGGYGP